jgi:hypothetical protein
MIQLLYTGRHVNDFANVCTIKSSLGIPRPHGLTRALATPKVESGSAFTRSWCSWVRLSLIGWLADERPVRIGDNVDHIVFLFDAAGAINGCLSRMTFLHRVPAKGTGDGIPDADALGWPEFWSLD